MSKESGTLPRAGLTPKQQRFVAEYLKDLNASAAYRRAGYAAKDADVNGPALMGNHRIAAAIAAGTARQLEKAELTGAMVKARLRLLGFQDIRKLFDAAGNLLPIHSLSDDAAPMIAGMEVIIKNAAAGDGVTDRIHKVKVVDQVKPLELLAKHFGLLDEHVVHSGGITLTHELPE